MATAATDTSVEFHDGVRASRMRVPRTRGALGGLSLMVLGAWAALVPFIGPYFDFGSEPDAGTSWNWTAGRGWLEVAPGVAAFVGGLILLLSRNRLTLTVAGWLAAAGGAWLVVGPALANQVSITLGGPDPAASQGTQTLEMLFYFYATGAAIVLFAALAIGRISVHSLRDVHAGQKRLAAEAEAERHAAEQRAEQDRAHRARQSEPVSDRGPDTTHDDQSSAARHDAGGTAEREYAHHGISDDSGASDGYPPYQRNETN